MTQSVREKTAAWLLAMAFGTLGAFAQDAAPSAVLDELVSQPAIRVRQEEVAPIMAQVHDLILGRTSHRPALWNDDAAFRRVMLSAGDGRRAAVSSRGSGKGLWAAIRDAAGRLSLRVARDRPSQARLEIIASVAPVENVDFTKWRGYVPGMDGLAFERETGLVLFPSELLRAGVGTRNRVIELKEMIGLVPPRDGTGSLRERILAGGRVPVRRFRVLDLFTDGAKSFVLCGSHRVLWPVEQKDLEEALKEMAKAFLTSIRKDGSFRYLYDPVTDTEADSYNLPRHAGTLWAIADLYAHEPDPRLAEAARRGIQNLLQYAKPFGRPGDDALCLVREGKAKLGSAALAVLALARYQEVTRDARFEKACRRFGNMLMLSQLPSGRFINRFQYKGSLADVLWQSIYYPGEATLALARLHRLTGEVRWLEAAALSAKYLVNVRDKGVSLEDLIHDHWLLLALNELHALGVEGPWPTHMRRLAAAILEAQNRRAEVPENVGGFRGDAYVTPAATRVEGLIAAYHLARRAGMKVTSERIFAAAALSVAFQARLQYRPESTFGFARPAAALGGFPASVGWPVMRIDFLQHNASSFLGFLRILKTEKRSHPFPPDSREARLIRQAQENVLNPGPRLERHVEWIRAR